MPRLSPRYVFLGLGGLALVLVLLLPQLHSLIPAFRATLSDTEWLTLDLNPNWLDCPDSRRSSESAGIPRELRPRLEPGPIRGPPARLSSQRMDPG
jgi:hypothetical protein